MGPRRIAIVLFLALLAILPPATAAERKLFTLQSVPPGIELDVLDVAGLKLAQKPGPAPRWLFKPGDTITADTRPGDRVIELYTGTPQAPSLLCRVVLRYYAGPSGWAPQFLLDEEPLVARVNGRWQPFELIRGTGGMLVRHGHALPNAEGFFPTLELGLGAGSLAVVAWRVVR